MSLDGRHDTTKTASRKRPARPEATATTTKKPPSYLARRHERDALVEQAKVLATQLEQLRVRAGLPTREDRAAVDDVQARSLELDEKLHANELFLGRVNSMVTNELLLPTVNPMSTFIHLPCEMARRRAILRDLQDLKLRRGIEVAMERLYHVDHAMAYLSEENFTTASGEYHCHRREIDQFPNFKTAQALYDALLEFFESTAVSVTAGLGQLALREDTDDAREDRTIWNHRIVTVADDVGCTEELNSVGFARFYPHSSYTNSPMGVIVYDTVNVDDLYPYRPHERTSKDVQAAHLVYELGTPGSDDVLVVLKECYDIVQLVPQFHIETDKLRQLQQNSTRWPAYIIKYLRDYYMQSDDSNVDAWAARVNRT